MPATRAKIVLPWLLLALAICLAGSGCVTRRMMINSNVPGGVVYVDDQRIGNTPAAAPFTYYGTRKITIITDGYETLTTYHTFERPWYEYPVIEFFSESLWPWEIDDIHELNFDMVPQRVVPVSETVARGEILRSNAAAGVVPALPEQAPGYVGPPPILPAPAVPVETLPAPGFQPTPATLEPLPAP